MQGEWKILNPYEVLGVTENVTLEQLKKQYRLMVLKHHPDRNNGRTTELFKKIVEAYETILKEIHSKKIINQRITFYQGFFNDNTTSAAYQQDGYTTTWTINFR